MGESTVFGSFGTGRSGGNYAKTSRFSLFWRAPLTLPCTLQEGIGFNFQESWLYSIFAYVRNLGNSGGLFCIGGGQQVNLVIKIKNTLPYRYDKRTAIAYRPNLSEKGQKICGMQQQPFLKTLRHRERRGLQSRYILE